MSKPTKDSVSMRDAGGGPPAGGTASDGDESNMQGTPTWSPQGSCPVSDSTSGPEATSSQGNRSSNQDFYQVQKAANSPTDCSCDACAVWTIVYREHGDTEITELGQSWEDRKSVV